MLVGVMFKDEWLDIVLPANKVQVVIIDLIAKKNRITKEQAKAMFNQHDQAYFERKFEKEIKREFSSYISNEVSGWLNYDEKLNKLKRNKK